jgi:hypothetical protein
VKSIISILCLSSVFLFSCGQKDDYVVETVGTSFVPETIMEVVPETVPETTTTVPVTTVPILETTVPKTTSTLQKPVKPAPKTTTTIPKNETATPTQAKGSCKDWIQQAGIEEVESAYYIVMKESTCNPNARNKSSGACGLVQANPCSKLGGNWSDPVHALKWADSYVKSRYGSWSGAVSHSKKHGWY